MARTQAEKDSDPVILSMIRFDDEKVNADNDVVSFGPGDEETFAEFLATREDGAAIIARLTEKGVIANFPGGIAEAKPKARGKKAKVEPPTE